MSKKDRYTPSPTSKISFLKKQAILEDFEKENLTFILGQPHHGHNEKAEIEWVMCGPNGSVIVIYNKLDENLFDKKWYIDAAKPEQAKDFLKWLRGKK